MTHERIVILNGQCLVADLIGSISNNRIPYLGNCQSQVADLSLQASDTR
jgi:hypothetical protein